MSMAILSVNEYSKKVGKTTRATYNQLNRKKYKHLWEENHVWKENGRTLIDDVAQEELNGSRQVTQVLVDEQLKYELDEIRKKYTALTEQHIQVLSELKNHSQVLIDYQDKAEKEKEKLRDEIALQQEGIIAYRRKYESEQTKSKELEQELERLKNRSLWQRLFNK